MSETETTASQDAGHTWAAQYLRDMIYGAMDGAVTTFAVVSGVTGAGLEPKIVIVLGVAGVVGDGFSMAAGNYMGTKADRQRVVESIDAVRDSGSNPFTAAATTFVAFLVAGVIPLLPYFASFAGSDVTSPAAVSTTLTLITFFAIGAGKAFVVPVRWWLAGLESLAVGAVAAALAYGCGAGLRQFIE